MQEDREASTLNPRRKKPSLRLNCFTNHQPSNGSINVSSPSPSPSPSPSSSSSSSSFFSAAGILPSPRKSPTAWIRSKAPDLPVIRDKYKKFTSRMGRHRCHSSADFSYDPLSYSRNFQERDDRPDEEDDDSHRSFTSRLPLSPPRSAPPPSSAAGTKMLRKTVSEIPSSNEAEPDQARLSLDESSKK